MLRDHASRRQAYAALDLGTNNCRLLIARPEGENFTVIDAFSRVVRLGEGLAASGRLSDEAMDRALGALQVCAEKLKRRNVFLARSVATEACRRAVNGRHFVERVRRETGICLEILTRLNTQSFELGDPNLKRESNWGAEASFKFKSDAFNLSLTGYSNWFDNFIYEDATGDEEDGLPVFQYFQRDARFTGFEAEARTFIDWLRSARLSTDGEAMGGILLPGDPERRTRAEREAAEKERDRAARLLDGSRLED